MCQLLYMSYVMPRLKRDMTTEVDRAALIDFCINQKIPLYPN